MSVLPVSLIEFGGLIAFSVVTEAVFQWPGLGSLILRALLLVDVPVIAGFLLVTAGLFVILSGLSNLLSSLLDVRTGPSSLLGKGVGV